MAELAINVGPVTARRIRVQGRVQGVGFRPFVYRLALRYGLHGHVQNQLGEVEILAAGSPHALERFLSDLVDCAPPLSAPQLADVVEVAPPPADRFEIIDSRANADAQVFVPPDYFMCDDCRRELEDPTDRRFAYPFINCTQCGPRYTLIEALPYDRPNTSMAGFPMCPECEAEYSNPADRRFHAEPVACATCGPRLVFEEPGALHIDDSDAALAYTVRAIQDGRIVAVKGIGGYHLVCDATNNAAVARLRERKHRPDKPLAVMFPVGGADGLARVRAHVDLDPAEAELARSPVRPIVLARRRPDCGLAKGIAPGLGEVGIFLPYSPLHQLLLDAVDGPLVATSGNISGEPVLTDNNEATRRLGGIADGFLQHDRPIVRPADDPVYRRIGGRMRPLRMGRGSAPSELPLPWALSRPVLAVGGQMKGTVALAWDQRIVVSPHIGEMDNPRSLDVFERVANDLQSLYGVRAEAILCDAHPGYTTHRWAQRRDRPVESIWHHEAHAGAVAAEYERSGTWLVFTWDGVGLGPDGTMWGGEALVGGPGAWHRFASLRTFRLPGGDKAGREPWRSAVALHWECGLDWAGSPDDDGLARIAWRQALNCPVTSAAGRLFDAAAALVLDLRAASFEAQGPMALEALCSQRAAGMTLPLARDADGILRSDWQPLLGMLTDDTIERSRRAEIFHASMAGVLLSQARAASEYYDIAQIGLAGGVFQNRFLTELATALLEADGFEVCLPSALPCNDAALSFGQVAEFAAREATT